MAKQSEQIDFQFPLFLSIWFASVLSVFCVLDAIHWKFAVVVWASVSLICFLIGIGFWIGIDIANRIERRKWEADKIKRWKEHGRV